MSKIFLKEKPNYIINQGDTNTVLASSIACNKLNYNKYKNHNKFKLVRVESGLRSYDRSMPEEINRIVTDSISDFLFTTSKNASENLIREGKNKKEIFFVGNTMIDTLLANVNNLVVPEVSKNNILKPKNYFVLTLHRPKNVDDDKKFIKLLKVLGELTQNWPIVFPVHPRVKKDLISQSSYCHLIYFYSFVGHFL